MKHFVLQFRVSYSKLIFLFFNFEFVTQVKVKLFIFKLRISSLKVEKLKLKLRVSNSKFNLISYEQRIYIKIFQLVTQSVTSSCKTRFHNSISELENFEPHVFLSKTVHLLFFFLHKKQR